MCKVMILKGVEDSTLALSFMKAVAPNMSLHNTDGIGYSAVNSKNKMFSEKWHYNKQFLELDTVIDQATLDALAQYKARIPFINLNYQAYGEVTRDDLKTITMHTRYATCSKEFANTHPFIDHDISLIHNGGISNCNVLNLNRISTCDSEAALQLYNNEQVNLQTKTEGFQKFIDQLKGYWAFAFLAKDMNGNYMLDIVRERAPLYWAAIPEMGEDCIVFATTSEIIEIGIKEIDLSIRTKIWSLSESNYHRFNAVTGEFIENYVLDESALNSYYYYPSKKYKYNGNTVINDVVEKKPVQPQDEIYEGYKANKADMIEERKFKDAMLGINNDDLTIESFYETDNLLIDRLDDYDKLMGTSYCDSFEDLPGKVKLFIERKEEEDYIIFDTILEMIESFQDTDRISGIYKIFKNKKRA